jgi:hypothetical protein
MARPTNPKNVPTGGAMTYAAMERATSKQLRALSMLKRTAGNPPTWDDTCELILGDDWDGVYENLSLAAASWLIDGLRRGLLAVAEPDELVIP